MLKTTNVNQEKDYKNFEFQLGKMMHIIHGIKYGISSKHFTLIERYDHDIL